MFQIMSFRRTGRGAGAGRALDRTHRHIPSEFPNARHNVEKCAHVGGLFLNLDDFSCLGVARELGGEFGFRKRIKLIEKDDRGFGIAATLALRAKFVPDFSGAKQNSAHVLDLAFRDDIQKTLFRELREGGGRFRPSQHAFRRENHQRFAPTAKRLAAQ